MLDFLGDYGKINLRTVKEKNFRKGLFRSTLTTPHKTANLSSIFSLKAKLSNLSLKLTHVVTEVLATVLNLKS